MVLGVKMAEIYKKKHMKNPIWKNTKKAPRIIDIVCISQ